MLYDVEQVANKLNVSKTSIYNKLKLKEYKGKFIKKAGKSYIDEELFNLIKESLKVKNEVKSENVRNSINSEIAIDESTSFNLNKDIIDIFKNQLAEKDKQIAELSERLAKEQELHNNTQILYKQQQEIPQQNILLLEQHQEEFNNKLNVIIEQMQDREDHSKKPGILNRIFKK